MKKFLVLATAVAILISSIGCTKNESNSDEGQVYELKLGTVLTENDPVYKGYELLKKNVEERTGGKLIISLYPSSQLGADKDILEQAKLGTNVAVITDSSRLSEIIPEFGIMAAPYVFRNYDEVRAFVDTDLFMEWSDKFSGSGYQLLSFNWYQGDRHFLTNVPVEKPEDLNGINIRSMGSKIAMDSLNAMGCNATPMAWSEVYTGIQQKAIDGAEAQLPAVDGSKLYEVISHIALTGHFQLNTGLVTSEAWFNELPEEFQAILLEESMIAGDFASQLVLDGLAQYQKDMEAEGVTFHTVDLQPFIDASQVVYEDNNLLELKSQIDSALEY